MENIKVRVALKNNGRISKGLQSVTEMTLAQFLEKCRTVEDYQDTHTVTMALVAGEKTYRHVRVEFDEELWFSKLVDIKSKKVLVRG